MVAPKIFPVILCGGGGTRLWPLSLKSKPKPFVPLIGDKTLFEQAIARVSNPDHFAPVCVVAGEAHVDLVESQLGGASDTSLIVEPSGRNTAPAIALAAARLAPEAVMLVCPSDHHIADEEAFEQAALAAADLARDDRLVSFGIEPVSPETGYGYLERGEPIAGGFEIERFVEKPSPDLAKEYLASRRFSWNGGIFAFRVGHLLDELAEHRPEMARQVRASVEKGTERGNRFYPDPASFNQIDGESIDYAVMENTARAAMVPASMGWSDIGNWAALSDALVETADPDGNVVRGGPTDLEQCHRVFALSDGPRISAIGLADVCVIVSGDEVLVTTREEAQRVGRLPGAANQ